MARSLFAIANATGTDAEYSSMEYPDDACDVANNAVIHTGGSDGDFVLIADCSDSRYYREHHDTIRAQDGPWTITFWNDDHDRHLLYWAAGDHYSHANPVPLSKEWDDVCLLIRPGPVLFCSPC